MQQMTIDEVIERLQRVRRELGEDGTLPCRIHVDEQDEVFHIGGVQNAEDCNGGFAGVLIFAADKAENDEDGE